jgi:O-antigen ligase
MLLSLKNYILANNKGRRNAIFILLLVFGFPAIAIINYSLEVQSGIISKAYRLINLLICALLIFEFIVSPRFKNLYSFKLNKNLISKKAPLILFLFFWGIYLLRMVIDLEVYHVVNLADYPNSYYYLFAVAITIIPMLAVLTINEIDVDFLQLSLHRYLVVINCLLLLIFILGKVFNPIPDYRFYVMRNDFYYLNAITIAVYGSVLMLTSFLSKTKSLISYLLIALGFFIVLTTASRGPILSILLALLFILFFKDKKISIKYLYLTLALAFSVLINYLASIFFEKYYIAGNPLLHRLNNVLDDQSTVSRIKIYKDGITQFLEGPFFGTHFLVVESSMYAHNLLLDILLATGILGLLLIIPIFLIFARNILSKSHTIFLSVIGFYLFLNTLTSGACYNMNEFWIFFALIIVYKNTFDTTKLSQDK